jgi:predicted ATP-grasp superfamily ATP-dependent carboligase
LRLLVYEHVSGGGFADSEIAPSVLCEGFGMLRTLVADFKAAGHNVTSTLDSRIARLNPPIGADCVVPISSLQDAQENFQKIAERVEAVYVVAPETKSVLRSLVGFVERKKPASLNCSACAIEKLSDKAFFYESLRKIGLPHPETMMFSVADDLKEVRRTIRGVLSFPLVFKPSTGVSCCGLSMVGNEDQIAGALEKIKQESSSEHFLVQELIIGAAASVSLISTGTRAVPISLNRQDVTIGKPEACSEYSGGLVPFDHSLQAEAFEVAKKLVEFFKELRGYVGVDFVLNEDEPVVVEVNPRLTTSYVGLRRVVNFNPAQAIANAVLKRELPKHTQSSGYTNFSKVKGHHPQLAALQKTYRIKEVVSPPFPVSKNNNSSALVATSGITPKEAAAKFREAKKRVLNTISRGK